MVILQDLLSTLITASDSSWKVSEMKPLSEQSSSASKFAHLILLSIPSLLEYDVCCFFSLLKSQEVENDAKT